MRMLLPMLLISLLPVIMIIALSRDARAQSFLARDGASQYRIVLPPDPIPAERYAAEELQNLFKQSTGAELPIVDAAAPPADFEIVIGAGPRSTELAPDVVVSALGDEGFVLRTAGNRLLVVGGRPRGVLYGVYDLAERVLGVRFFAPDCTKIPEHKTLELPALDYYFRPALEYREIVYNHCYNVDFAVRLRLNCNRKPLDEKFGGGWNFGLGGHSFASLVPPQKYAKDHPEFYSLIDGKRDPTGQLCLTNPDVMNVAAEGVLKIFREQPQINAVWISQMDFEKWCQCERCRKLNELERRPTARPQDCEMPAVLNFCNEIARRIEPEFPDKWICTLSYKGTWSPPRTIRPRRNVLIRFAPIRMCYSHPLESCPTNAWLLDYLKEWDQVGARVHVWDYVVTFVHYICPHPNWNVLKPNLLTYMQHGATGYMGQGASHIHSTELAELRAWVLARLMWDPSQDADKLIDEFLGGYYGPAAGPIREYITMLERSVDNPPIHLGIKNNPLRLPMPGSTLTLDRILPGSGESATAFASATFDSPAARTAAVTIASTGDVKVWVNDTQVAAFFGQRDLQDEMKMNNRFDTAKGVSLRAGTNRVLVQSARRSPEWTVAFGVDGLPPIRNWLVLGPLPSADNENDLLAVAQVPPTAEPAAGEQTAGAAWQAYTVPDAPRYFSNEMLEKSINLFDRARELVKDDPVLATRVKTASLPVQYVQIWRMPVDQRRISPITKHFIDFCGKRDIRDVGEWRVHASGLPTLRAFLEKMWELK